MWIFLQKRAVFWVKTLLTVHISIIHTILNSGNPFSTNKIWKLTNLKSLQFPASLWTNQKAFKVMWIPPFNLGNQSVFWLVPIFEGWLRMCDTLFCKPSEYRRLELKGIKVTNYPIILLKYHLPYKIFLIKAHIYIFQVQRFDFLHHFKKELF